MSGGRASTPTTHPPRESARPVQAADIDTFTAEVDAIVVGGGAGGFAAALFLAWRGNDVILLEKAADVGGTSRKSAFGYWIPNNAPMRAAGIDDPRDDFLRLVARLSYPQRYDPESATFGLTPSDFDIAAALYDSGPEAAELLNKKGALPYRHQDFMVDYFAQVPENKAPTGRVLAPRDAAQDTHDGGEVAFSTLVPSAEKAGVRIVRGCRVQRLVVDGDAVVGVQGTTSAGATPAYYARRAIVFATGGFVHDPELLQNFLDGPVFPGCAVHGNEGDLVHIAGAVGVPMRNMSSAWLAPMLFEKVVTRDPKVMAMAGIAGDSMIIVDREGQRVVNEKLPYNEVATAFFRKDLVTGEYPNVVMFAVWDERSQRHSAGNYTGMIVPEGEDDGHVITAPTLELLEEELAKRLARHVSATGNLRLVDGFAAELRATINRFNRFAAEGVDHDFHRGETPFQVLFNGKVKDEGERRNVTMWPIAGTGPYHAALICGAAMDTKGGPKINADAQLLDDDGRPIPGLYGTGNCVAAVSRAAYWAAGATIGPAITMAYRAAMAIDREPRRSFAPLEARVVTS